MACGGTRHHCLVKPHHAFGARCQSHAGWCGKHKVWHYKGPSSEKCVQCVNERERDEAEARRLREEARDNNGRAPQPINNIDSKHTEPGKDDAKPTQAAKAKKANKYNGKGAVKWVGAKRTEHVSKNITANTNGPKAGNVKGKGAKVYKSKGNGKH